ncbi:addiction module protein [Desulfurivibrio dismutans]|uniref:addiction module protein n=1 Tax=Desulfurivibrio dismutans TaxID=1398908 RepID=UPI003D64F2F1
MGLLTTWTKATSASDVPVHDWQKKELDLRKANFMSNPDSGRSWSEVKTRIRMSHERHQKTGST